MSRPLSFGAAASAIVLAAMLASCAAPEQKTSFGGKADENVGLATRAMMALNAHDLPAAIDFAERAVEKSPGDAGFRALLGNAYFTAGRFRSAEAAYKDSLTIYSNQPQVILKLALAEIALGKKDQAAAFLEAGRSVLDPSNYGLALALAGRPADAIAVLDSAARQQGADATVRQNLALAHALAGDWTEARTIAEQDVPESQLDARLHQWMQLASPKSNSEQIASLVGVTPASVDNGEPVRIALRKSDVMLADAAPAPSVAPAPVAGHAPTVEHAQVIERAPIVQPAPQLQIAQTAPEAAREPRLVDAVVASAPAPQATAAIVPVPKPASRQVIAEAPLPTPVAMIAAAAEEVSSAAAHRLEAAVEAFVPKRAVRTARPAKRRLAAAAHAPRPGEVVIQLGSYRSPNYVAAAWNTLTERHPALRAYLPMRARFDSPKGTFWRLSIQGFGDQRQAIARCHELRSHGSNCFVRSIAGDAPVQFASR